VEEKVMQYRLVTTIDDTLEAGTDYEAFLMFFERFTSGYYGPAREDISQIENTDYTTTPSFPD
jgi:hypothetical protein